MDDSASRLDEHDLELIESLLLEASPGPWRFAEDESSGKWCIVGPDEQRLFEEPASDQHESSGSFAGVQADYRLAALSRIALPRLIGELRRLRRFASRLAELQTELAGEPGAPIAHDDGGGHGRPEE